MVSILEGTTEDIAYCYCSFEYTGAIKQKFPARSFNPDALKKMNYISRNSMFKIKVLEEIPLIDDDYYKRLLDWAYYLHLLNHGYIGIPYLKGYFKAVTGKESVSAQGTQDFYLKYKRVSEDFIKE